MPAQAGFRGVRDRLQRIGATHVVGDRVVFEIQLQRVRVKDHVLDHGAETRAGGVDFRLGLGRKVDGLGIAAAFEVEDALVRPAVFVIADQHARGIGRQRGLAGARQAEEDGAVVGVADGVVGGTMHRHDALFRQQIVQQREDRLLVLARIGRVADQDQLAREVQRDHRLAAAAVAHRIGPEARQVDDGIFGRETRQLVLGRAYQQGADEQVVPGQFVDDPHVQAVVGIGAAEQILHKVITALHVVQHVGIQPVKGLGRHRLVVFPPDRVLDLGGADHELVLGRTAGMRPGGHQEGAPQSHLAFFARDRLGHQGRLQKVVINPAKALDSLILKLAVRVYTGGHDIDAPHSIGLATRS